MILMEGHFLRKKVIGIELDLASLYKLGLTELIVSICVSTNSPHWLAAHR